MLERVCGICVSEAEAEQLGTFRISNFNGAPRE